MKKIGFAFMVLACVAISIGPVWAAENPRPAATQLLKNFAERNGQSLPDLNYVYLVDLVSNASSAGFSTVFVLTNYDDTSRIHIQGFVVPKGVNPGSEILVDEWLNPYEVKYIDLRKYLSDENGWALLYSTKDFGCGALIFNTTQIGGMTWVKPWYWTTN